ncbi:hypothetical protein F383_25663 [Gossypium arboreum]|uniref:Uncharacterized protein n=1 Tax=Gossypium arboreum TaxID=29729 RepID=A0A0B0P5M1_GOSAR|nr:hypothetical protein F383_25663 [Gossypium arboreum]
MLGTSRNEKKS